MIEGRFLPDVREPEGPFGEFPQYYGERAPREVMEIVAVTHRKDAIFHTIVGGGLEHQLLGAIPKEATLLTHLRRNFPNVLDVHLSPGGVMRFHLFVKIRKTQEGQGKNVILGAFAGSFDLKHVIVVDEDVDIHNPTEVEWAVATRFQADRDLVIVPDSQGSKLDPSNRDGVGAKMGHRRDQAAQGAGDGVQAHPRAGRGGDRRRRGAQALGQRLARGAEVLAILLRVIPGRGAAANPESITHCCGYGFRVRAFRAPRNDAWQPAQNQASTGSNCVRKPPLPRPAIGARLAPSTLEHLPGCAT